MRKIKVKFLGIGRNNINFEADCKGKLTWNWLYKQIKPYVLSSNISFEDNGTIWAGMVRMIGRFEVEKAG